jgi:hypothetical protein
MMLMEDTFQYRFSTSTRGRRAGRRVQWNYALNRHGSEGEVGHGRS